jgi:hypothetical protein
MERRHWVTLNLNPLHKFSQWQQKRITIITNVNFRVRWRENYNKEKIWWDALPKPTPRLTFRSMMVWSSTTAKALTPITLITISTVRLIIVKMIGFMMLLLLVFVLLNRILKHLERVVTIARRTGFSVFLFVGLDLLSLYHQIIIRTSIAKHKFLSYWPFPCLFLRPPSRQLSVCAVSACHPLLVSSNDFCLHPKFELREEKN